MSEDKQIQTPKMPLSSSDEDIDVVEVTHETPYHDIKFMGTYLATALGVLASYGGFLMPASSLTLINADLGPSPNIDWVTLAWTLCLAVGYTLVGRLSDIFGRRYFFIVASALATIGCIIGGTAKNVNTLIGAEVFIGLGAAAQLSFNYTIGELVPMRHRFVVLTGLFLFGIPFAAFGPYIGRLFIVNTGPAWRWCFYVNIITNGLSTLLYIIFYHPPNFDQLHKNRRSRLQELKELDWIGLFLYAGGVLIFLLGLSWGGTLYAWDSAHVIATLVVGGVTCIVFVLWECFVAHQRPIIPMHLYRNRDYAILTIVTTVGGMLYYSLNVVYPVMVGALYTTDLVYAGLLSCAISGGVLCGQFTASALATVGGHIKYKLIFSTAITTVFTAALSVANTREKGSAFAVIGAFGIGSLESLAVPLITLVIDDQSEIGAAVGTFGTVRSIGGVVATAILVTVLTNKASHYTMSIVVPALLKAGLPPSSIPAFLAALDSGSLTALEKVPGVTKQIIGAGVVSVKEAYQKTFYVVFLVTLAFGLPAFIASFFAPNADDRLTEDVTRRLTGRIKDVETTKMKNGKSNSAADVIESA